jgi:YesN/AraC family two-component response regulator
VVAVGPLLTEPMHSGEIVNIIQREKVPIRLKSRLEAYYRDVTQVSTQTYYYCGRLLSAIFSAKNTGVPKNPHPIGSEVSSIKEYFQNTYKNREKLFTHPPFFLEKKIVNQIKIGNLDGALSTLDEINLLSRATLAKDPLRSMKDSIICSCAFFTRAVIEAGVFPDIAFTYSDTFIQQIEKMDSLAEVSRYERNILAEFIKLTKENASAKYSRVILSAMQYINDNLTLKLSLSDIAKHAYVHPNYLSSIFKKEVGCSLTDYIARRRIEESTYFIAYTDFEIADIANFYHFCNQSYYITTFKRYLSVSPNEYRNSDRPSL